MHQQFHDADSKHVWGYKCTWLYCVATLSWGLQGSIIGPTAITLAQQVGCKESDFGFVVGLAGLCYILGGIPAGWLCDVMPCHRLLAIVTSLQAIVLALIPSCNTLASLAGAFCILNLTYNSTNAVTTAAVAWLYPQTNNLWYNVLCAVYGLGSLLTPMLVAFLRPTIVGTAHLYYIAATAATCSAVFSVFVPSPTPETTCEDPTRIRKRKKPWCKPEKNNWLILILMCSMQFISLSTMCNFGNWVFAYVIQQQHGSALDAAMVNSIFWAFLFGGRVLSSILAFWLGPVTILMLSVPLACVGAMVPLLSKLHPLPLPTLLIAVAAIGLGNSTGSGNSFALVARYIPVDALTNTLSCVTVGVAATALPAAMPWLAMHTALQFDMLMLLTAATSAVHILLVLLTRMVGKRILQKRLQRLLTGDEEAPAVLEARTSTEPTSADPSIWHIASKVATEPRDSSDQSLTTPLLTAAVQPLIDSSTANDDSEDEDPAKYISRPLSPGH